MLTETSLTDLKIEPVTWALSFRNKNIIFNERSGTMSAMKRWFEDHISDFTDEELLKDGYEQEDIDFMRECFTGKKDES